MSRKEADLVKGIRENVTEQHFIRDLEEMSRKAFQTENSMRKEMEYEGVWKCPVVYPRSHRLTEVGVTLKFSD